MAWHLVMVFRTLGDIRVRIGSVTSGLGVVDRKISYGYLQIKPLLCCPGNVPILLENLMLKEN